MDSSDRAVNQVQALRAWGPVSLDMKLLWLNCTYGSVHFLHFSCTSIKRQKQNT